MIESRDRAREPAGDEHGPGRDGHGPGRDGHGPGRDGHGRSETVLERWDRNFTELLQEVRVAQTGVQILFAFLLTLPFSNRFGEIGRLEKVTYVVTMVAAAVAAGLLIAPVSYHRMVFRQGRKPELVRAASALAKGGLAVLLVAMMGAVFLVVSVVVGSPLAGVLTGVLAAGYLVAWYVVPLLRRTRSSGGDR